MPAEYQKQKRVQEVALKTSTFKILASFARILSTHFFSCFRRSHIELLGILRLCLYFFTKNPIIRFAASILPIAATGRLKYADSLDFLTVGSFGVQLKC